MPWHGRSFRFVSSPGLYLLLLASTPSAINLSTISTLHDYSKEVASQLLFWQYVLAPLPMACWIALYISICFR